MEGKRSRRATRKYGSSRREGAPAGGGTVEAALKPQTAKASHSAPATARAKPLEREQRGAAGAGSTLASTRYA
jgi:hypothetical protein